MITTKYRILDVIDYIEESLGAPLSLKNISNKFELSQYHLHRIFTKLTGLPIMSYIRGRRLANSLKLLTFKNFKIIDIALMSGFNYEQAFIRAFKQEFNITPNKYRKSSKPLKVTSKVDIEHIKLIENGIFLPPDIVYFSKKNVISSTYLIKENDPDYNNKAKKLSINFHTNIIKDVKGDLNRSTLYSFFEPINSGYKTYLYSPAVSYKTINEIPKEVVKRAIKPGNYIRFKYIGNHSIDELNADFLKGSYTYVYKNYKDYINKNWNNKFKIERIDMSLNRPDYCELDMFYPVKELF